MKIIKFSTSRCGPCKIYAPIIEEFAKDKWIELIEVDAENPWEYSIYNVSSVPTTVFKIWDYSQKIVGVKQREELDAIYNSLTTWNNQAEVE